MRPIRVAVDWSLILSHHTPAAASTCCSLHVVSFPINLSTNRLVLIWRTEYPSYAVVIMPGPFIVCGNYHSHQLAVSVLSWTRLSSQPFQPTSLK
jgi:hypothetical protein